MLFEAELYLNKRSHPLPFYLRSTKSFTANRQSVLKKQSVPR